MWAPCLARRMLPQRLHPIVAFCVGAGSFAALKPVTSWIVKTAALDPDSMAARQIVIKSEMLVLSAALMLLIARPRTVWGLALPRAPGGWLIGTLVPAAIGGMLGVVATAAIVGFGFPPMSGLREMGLLLMIPIVWFGSTFAEEVFVRGLIQGWMQPIPTTTSTSTTLAVDQSMLKSGRPDNAAGRIIASGLLFGAMHASLFFSDNDARTATTIVMATTLLGLTCAWSRERSGSLVGPLLAHFAFNACGIFGGIAVVIFKGSLPSPT